MGKIPEKLNETCALLAQKFEGKQHAIRGTASLALQGLDFNAADIDIICDEETAMFANEALREFVADEVKYSESPKFKSFFGKFEINGIEVEIMGNWQIRSSKGEWSKVYDGSDKASVDVDGVEVFATTPEEELEMFMFMERWNAYHKLKKLIELQNSNQLELFNLA